MGICGSVEKSDGHDPVDKKNLDGTGADKKSEAGNGSNGKAPEKQIAVQPKKPDPAPPAAEVQLSANAGAAASSAPAPAASAGGGEQPRSGGNSGGVSGGGGGSGNTLAVPVFDGQPRTSTTVVGNASEENVQIALVDTPTSAQEIANYLKNVPVLAKLSHDDRVVLAEALKLKQYKVGSPIVREGEEGHEFFIIKKGKAVVTRKDPESKKEVELGKLNAGDYFGETALLTDARRGATITAFEGDVLCLTLERKTFSDHFSKHKLNVAYAKRAAVSAEASGHEDKGSAEEKKNTAKDASKRRMVLEAIKVNMLFRNLTIEQQESIVDKMWLRDVKSGTKIISQGELGDTFYVVDSGEFDIFKDGKQVAHRAAGSSFGELALMYNAPRAATVQAKSNCTVWMVDRNTYRHLMTDTSVRRLKEIEAFLRTVQLFAPLTDAERSKIGEALEEANFPDNYQIVKQGDEGDTFFILKKGETVCTQQETPQSAPKEIKRYMAGEYFGERALIKNAPRAATITTVGPCAVYYMNRQAFTQLLGPLEEILKARADSYKLLQDEYKKRQEAAAARGEVLSDGAPASPRSAANASAAAAAQTKTEEAPSHLDKNIKLSDLTVIGTLGKGSFGHVQLVRDRSNKTHALKSVNKAQIVQLGQQEHIMSEKRVMAQLDHPFLVRLNATFKDQNYLYFLLEPSLGGELFSVLRAKTFFDEETARFFAASVVLAFEYMHLKDIIYRDLKPENLLLDDLGYLKITDFGFAKKVKDRTWTLCGTPDYLAPEVVSGQGHGKGVDWWTLGILIYEMLASYPPFYDEDPMKTYAKIMHGHVAFPMHFSKAAIDLIKQLLHPKPTKRLGVIKGGASLIKSHAWFKGFDWDAFYHRKLAAPIKNTIKNAEDLSNFEKYPDEELNHEPYVPDPKNPNWDADF